MLSVTACRIRRHLQIPVHHNEFMTTTNALPGRGSPSGALAPLAVELRGVHKSFGSVQAVDGIDLSIASGEIVAFLGPNGAGKTSTIDVILGLSRPSAGAVSVLGMTPHQAITRGLVSAVLQTGGLLKDLTVAETARYTASLFTQPRPVSEVLERAGIAAIADRRVGKCSGGEQQRLRFAMALLSDPELLILDEPFSGLDPIGVDTMAAVLNERRASGVGVLFSSHQLELVERLCDRVVIVRAGRVVADGTLDELRSTAPREHLEVIVDADPSWVGALAGVHIVERDGKRLVLSLDDPDSDQALLAAAASAGRVEQFGWRRPSLGELYREAISQ